MGLVAQGARKVYLVAVDVGLVGEVLVREVWVNLPDYLRRLIGWPGKIARRHVGNRWLVLGLILQRLWFRRLRFFLQSVKLFGHFIDRELRQFDYAIFIRRKPLNQFLAGNPLRWLSLAQSFNQQHQRSTVTIILLQIRQSILQLLVLELVIRLVECAGVGECGCVEAGESDGEGFIECEVS